MTVTAGKIVALEDKVDDACTEAMFEESEDDIEDRAVDEELGVIEYW